MALDLGSSSNTAGNFGGALVTGIVVSIVLVVVIGGIILLAALYWRKVVLKIAPNKAAVPDSEKAWPKPPPSSGSQDSGDSSTASSLGLSSRSGSLRKSDPVIIEEIREIEPTKPPSIKIPSMVFDKPFLESEIRSNFEVSIRSDSESVSSSSSRTSPRSSSESESRPSSQSEPHPGAPVDVHLNPNDGADIHSEAKQHSHADGQTSSKHTE